MDFLKGKKTIIGSVVGGLTLVAWGLKWIDQETTTMILGAVLAWTGVSVRMAIKNKG